MAILTSRALLLLGCIVECLATTTNKLPSCNPPNPVDALPFNATGTSTFNVSLLQETFPQPWYISTTFKGFLDPIVNSPPRKLEMTSYIGVPSAFIDSIEANNTQACIYWFGTKNTGSDSQGSCNGVLDRQCISELYAVAGLRKIENGRCPDIRENLSAACLGDQFFVTQPLRFANNSCVSNPLQSPQKDLEIPGNYTIQSFAQRSRSIDADRTLEWYRKYLKQSEIMLVVIEQQESTKLKIDSQLVCLTAKNIGAPIPSAASSIQTINVTIIAFTLAILYSMIL